MRENRSVPPCPVIPVLNYPDPGAAAEWLSNAFGFRVRLRIGNHRIQMHAGEGCVTLRDGDAVPNQSANVQVRIQNAHAHLERARAMGARIVTELTEHEYGEQQYAAEDLFGHRWDFTETVRDVDPASWGGTLVEPEC